MLTKELAIKYLNSLLGVVQPTEGQVAYHTRLVEAIFYDERPLSHEEFTKRLNISLLL